MNHLLKIALILFLIPLGIIGMEKHDPIDQHQDISAAPVKLGKKKKTEKEK